MTDEMDEIIKIINQLISIFIYYTDNKVLEIIDPDNLMDIKRKETFRECSIYKDIYLLWKFSNIDEKIRLIEFVTEKGNNHDR